MCSMNNINKMEMGCVMIKKILMLGMIALMVNSVQAINIVLTNKTDVELTVLPYWKVGIAPYEERESDVVPGDPITLKPGASGRFIVANNKEGTIAFGAAGFDYKEKGGEYKSLMGASQLNACREGSAEARYSPSCIKFDPTSSTFKGVVRRLTLDEIKKYYPVPVYGPAPKPDDFLYDIESVE